METIKKSNFIKIVFNYHKNHNPNFDILEGYINKDSFITYCSPVNKDAAYQDEECMEYYTGKNYIVNSNKRSFSRSYKLDKIPKKYQTAFAELKNEYNKINKLELENI